MFRTKRSHQTVMLLSGFDHQVAGHVEESLLGVEGRFILKPMVKEDLFKRESKFYEQSLLSNHDTNSPGRFIPNYFGNLCCCTRATRLVESGSTFVSGSIPSGHPHIVLEDLTHNYRVPNVIDIKMGTCTYEPTATREKKEKEVKKYPHQSELGFRITGFKIHEDHQKAGYLCAGKPFGRSIQPSEAVAALALVFSDGTGLIRTDVVRALLEELEQLLRWVRGQNRYRFYCSSLLVVYEASRAAESNCKIGNDQLGKSTALIEGRGAGGPSLQAAVKAGQCSGNCQEVLQRMQAHIDNSAARQESGMPPLVRVKMIDFAHVVEVGSALDAADGEGEGEGARGGSSCEEVKSPGCGEDKGVADPGYVHGLTRLIAHLHEVLDQAEGPGDCGPLREGVRVLRERAVALGYHAYSS